MDEIEALFDPVSYQKGGAVLRMLRAYLLRDARQPPPLRRSLLQVLTTLRMRPSGACTVCWSVLKCVLTPAPPDTLTKCVLCPHVEALSLLMTQLV